MKNPQEFLEHIDTSASKLSYRLALFVSMYKKYRTKKSRILDIGCGQNAVLSNYMERGDTYVGCDYLKKIKNSKVKNYFHIDLNKQKLNVVTKEKYDVVFCGEVIEHLFSPDHLLMEIQKVLHKDGTLLLSSPNLAYLPNRFLLLLGIHPLFLENSSEYKLGRWYKSLGHMNNTEGHIRVFTYTAIRELFRLYNFSIIEQVSSTSFNKKFDLFIGKIHPSLAPNNVFVLKNTNYWDTQAKTYASNWTSPANQLLSKKETAIIQNEEDTLNKKKQCNFLDLGCGYGRIIDALLSGPLPKSYTIQGVDSSNEMIELCKQKYKKNKQISFVSFKQWYAHPEKEKYDYISAIRVLKYNENWKEILEALYYTLKKGGVCVFSIPNRNSLSRFSQYGTPVYQTNMEELQNILKTMHVSNFNIVALSRLPGWFYFTLHSQLLVHVLMKCEEVLAKILGKTTGGKILYVSFTK